MKSNMNMKRKGVALALALTMVISSGAAAFAAEPAGDLTSNHPEWNTYAAYPSDVVNTKYFSAVSWLMNRKIINGYEDGLFHPERTITRAEYVKMVIIATNNEDTGDPYQETQFSDISGHWAEKYIKTAVGLKLIQGMGDGTFQPDAAVTYAQVIAIYLRAKGITDEQMTGYGEWPDNYGKYAQMFNMTGDILVEDWNAPAPRGDVARILHRNLPK